MKTYDGNTVDYWKQNAEEDYSTTPISVLKYITVLETQSEQLRKHNVVGQRKQLKCDCCNGTGMVEGDCIDELESCLTCNGKGSFNYLQLP